MKFRASFACAFLVAALLVQTAVPQRSSTDPLARHRNLGKAFYENPTTQAEAVEEFRKALQLSPGSIPDRLNYALALLRAGKTVEAIRELEAVQKQDPKLPHTYFNLGITFKKQGEHDRALQQFERMVQLVPDEPVSHYNLGTLYKLAGKGEAAIEQFQIAAKLDPNLAAPHFQLYNAYRTTGKTEEMRRELQTFQRLKKQQEGAAIPEDVEWCEYAEVYDVMADQAPAEPVAELKFAVRSSGPPARGAVVLDTAGSGKTQVLTWSEQGIRLDGVPVIPDIKDATAVVPGDFNNDGVEDLCILTPSGPALFVNLKGKFTRLSAKLPAGLFRQAVWLDYDHDYDLDLFLFGDKTVLLRNQGSAGFEDRTMDFPFVQAPALDAAAFRLVADTKGTDLLVAYAERGGVLYRDKLQGTFSAEPAPLPAGARRLHAVDINNDGWIDVLYAAGPDVQAVVNEKGRLREPKLIAKTGPEFVVADMENRGLADIVAAGNVVRNRGAGEFSSPEAIPALSGCTSLEAADVDGDGRVDVICASPAGVRLLTNLTQTKNSYIGVKLAGIKNLKLANGAEVEVKAGPRYQKQIYAGSPLRFGVGQQNQIDTVRITWPNGLIQNEVKQAAGKQYNYQEAQRLSGSCPIVWTWNGKNFEYITDVLGVAPLGASAGDGHYFPVDHDEYIQIPGGSLRAVNGAYEVRITEELSEVAYLDHIRLIAVDHEAGAEIYTNEKFQGPPFPAFRLFGVRAPIRPKAARDNAGRDVLDRLLAKDGTYPDAFPRDLSGVAAEHSLVLDFGRGAARNNKAVLVLSGWVDWADGSTFLGAAQEAGRGLVSPYLQVKDKAGNWRTVIEDMGMPAGKPKSIVVDLTGKFLSDSREIRIVTNLCVYWDEIFLSEEVGHPAVQMHTAPLNEAALRFRGFSPAIIDPKRTQPERFVYEGATPTSLWNPTPGWYTRYGDVRELASVIDDKMIIMGSGDELRLRFDAASLPPVRSGWTRDFLLLVDGWAKDRDANTAYSQSTEPLPFHGMSAYPYGADEHYPDDDAHGDYRGRYNTRPALRLLRPLISDRTNRLQNDAVAVRRDGSLARESRWTGLP